MTLATAPIKPGYRVLWIGLDGVSEIGGVVQRVFKQKAVILTTQFEKVTVPIDELALAPIKETKPATEQKPGEQNSRPIVEDPAAAPPSDATSSVATEQKPGEQNCNHDTFPTATGWICRNCFHRTEDSSAEWKAAYIQHLEKLKAGYERDRDRVPLDSKTGETRRGQIQKAVDELAEEIASLKSSVANSVANISEQIATEQDAIALGESSVANSVANIPEQIATEQDATAPGESSVANSVANIPEQIATEQDATAPGESSVANSVANIPEQIATEQIWNPSGWVERYHPGKKDHQYYCYNYREGTKRRSVHIPGGNTKNPIAKSRAEQVRDAIRSGKLPAEIVTTIRSWSCRQPLAPL